MITIRYFLLAVALLSTAAADETRIEDTSPVPDRIQFNRDVRPILSDTCFKCHGPDSVARKADLRLDSLAGATADLGGGYGAIVPGHPDQSEAFRRISSDDPEDKMPPPKSGMVLSPDQVKTIEK